MAYKVFANGDPLLASELNDNLMKQAIAVFSSTSARDAAITSPATGQFAFISDTNTLTQYTGSSWKAFSNPSPITTKTADYTIVASDANSTIFVNSSSQETITIADVMSTGDRIDFVQQGTGKILFDPDTGVNLYSQDSNYLTAGQYAAATVLFNGSDYYLIGNLGS